MNERIEAFIDQMSRTGLPYQAGDRELSVTGSDLEYFAELIVKECAKFLAENSGYDNSNNAWHPEPEDLLKHFGVE